MRRRLAVLPLLAAVLAGCSTVPTSSPTVQLPQSSAQADEPVGIEPLSPAAGATPEEVVSGFIDAAASTTRGHPVAREHLTPAAAKSWSDEAGITVISEDDYSAVTTERGTIKVTAELVGTVDQRGIFSLGEPETFTREYTLEQVRDEWRIADPVDGLVMLEPDFERLYDERTAYFLDPTGTRLVPDPRYLIAGDAQPTTLVDREIAGASAALAAGVQNPLEGGRLRRAITVSGQTVTVDLTGISPEPSPQLDQLCAQLVWTLQPFLASSVRILVDGEPLEGLPEVQTVDDWASFNPEGTAVDAVGHYLSGGAVLTVDGQPAPGPAGTGTYGLTGAAVSANPRDGTLTTMAGTNDGPGGATLLTGPYGGDLVPAFTARTLSQPSVAATRDEMWVVRDGDEVVRVPAGGPPQGVATPTLSGLGRATVLELSPDGVRAAVVVDGPQGPRLYVGTVIRAEDGAVSLPDLRQIAPTLGQVVDVAWRSSSTLLVLAGDAGQDRIVPYTVGVDGWGLDAVPTAGLPSQPTALAAAPGRQPLAAAGGAIFQLLGGAWATLVPGREPLPGGEPFFPE